MLRSKSTKIFSETKHYFTSSEKGILKVMELYKALKLNRLKIGLEVPPQTQYHRGDLLLGLLLLPLYSIANVHSYTQHALKDTLEAGKNTFYRLKNNGWINWRTIIDKCNGRLFKQLDKSDLQEQEEKGVKCLIVDDTDFEKSTYKTEHVGKLWSHVKHHWFWGFKGLFLGYWDGASFFGLDFSMHKERGKNKKKLYGLEAKQRKKQFRKKRDTGSYGKKREEELTKDKISMAINMVKRAMKKKIKVDYLLMDSWFFCESILIVALSLKIGIIAMAKMAKAKYDFQGKKYTAKELAELLKRRKKVKWIKGLKLYCAEVVVEYKGKPLKLYLCKNSKRGKWHLLVSTNTELGILKAYQIYSIRWSIEVFFKESKQYFGLGKSQSQDFDAQIADISLAMIGFNVLSLAKKFEAYQSTGGLFAHLKDQVTELTVCKRIWRFILELLQTIAEITDGDFNQLIIKILKNKPENNKIFRLIESSLAREA